MGEIKFHACGKDRFRIGDYTYPTKNLEAAPAKNCIGQSRYNRKTDQWEMYNPHKEGPHAR